MPKFFKLAFGGGASKASPSAFKDDLLGAKYEDGNDWAQCSLEHRRGARVKSYAVNIGASLPLKKAFSKSSSKASAPYVGQGNESSSTFSSVMQAVTFDAAVPLNKVGLQNANSPRALNKDSAMLQTQKTSLNRSALRFPALHEVNLDRALKRKVHRQALHEDVHSMLETSELVAVRRQPRRQGMCKGFDHSTCSTFRSAKEEPSKLNNLTESAKGRNANIVIPKPPLDGPPFMPTPSHTSLIHRRPVMFDTPYFEGRLPPGHETASCQKAKKVQDQAPLAADKLYGLLEQNLGSAKNNDGESTVTIMPGRVSEGPSNRRSDKRHTVFARQELRKKLGHRATLDGHADEEEADSDGGSVCSEEGPSIERERSSANARSLMWSLKLTSTVRQRVQRLKQARKLFSDMQEDGPGRMSQKAKVFLPESDVKRLKEVWDMYDADGSGDLDPKECAEVLADLGLKPKTRDEKIELTEIMEEVSGTGDGDVEFTQLCAIVHRLRLKVQEAGTKNLFTIFQKYDADDSNALDKEEVMQMLPELNLSPSVPEEEQAIWDVMAEVDADGSGEVEFPEFVTLVTKATERIQILRRRRELALKQEHFLDQDLFMQNRSEILKLRRIFETYDKDGSGSLDLDEIKDFISEVGLRPTAKRDQEEVESLCEEMEVLCDGAFNFKQVLLLLQKLRRRSIEGNRAQMRMLFGSYDKDRSGELSFGEVSKVLQDMGLNPQSKDQQDEIARMMEEADDDGSMELTFEEFLNLQQRIGEKLKAMQREYENEQAADMLFNPEQVSDLRNAFELIDQDGSGTLEVSEVRRALQLLGKRVSSDRLRELIFQIEGHESSSLEFVGFLMLIRELDHHVPSSADSPLKGQSTADAQASANTHRRAVTINK